MATVSEFEPPRNLIVAAAHRGVLWRSGGPPAVTPREPQYQPRHPHGGYLSDPPHPLGGARLLRSQGGRGQDQAGGDPIAEAQISNTVYRHLVLAAAKQGPGGQTGTTRSLRDRLCTLTAGSSAKSLPDPPHHRQPRPSTAVQSPSRRGRSQKPCASWTAPESMARSSALLSSPSRLTATIQSTISTCPRSAWSRPCGVQAPDSGAAWSEGGANDRV